MKLVPGRARSSRRLSVLESQTDNRHVNTVNRNRTIKGHYAPRVLDLRDEVGTWQQTLSPDMPLDSIVHPRAHATSSGESFSSAVRVSAISKIGAAT